MLSHFPRLSKDVIRKIEMDTLTSKYKNQLVIVAPAIYLFQMIFHAFSVNAPMKFIGIGFLSLLSFPIGLLMGFTVLGLQVKNPYARERHINSFCRAAFYFFYFVPIFLMIIGLLLPLQDNTLINFLPASFGIAFAAYKIKQKHGIIQERAS